MSGRVRAGVVRLFGCVLVLVVAEAVLAAAATAAPRYLTGHSYRHGAVPFRGTQHKTAPAPSLGFQPMAAFSHTANGATGADDVAFGGGISGVGVTTGAEQVYLVFWGSQWGTQSTNSSGDLTFSGDPDGVAPDLQAFFQGLGTNNETWSGVATQYCQGVAVGTFTCPASNTQHVAYPTGGALAGVWEDTSSVAPAAASAHQIGQEAEKAATHFGNTTTASNRNAQYVVVSPTGTDPDSYEFHGFCAWHDYTGDSTLDGGGAVSGSLLAFTNLPYIPDAGFSCGQNFVNGGSAGTLDGVTIVEGHEYAETITDQFPAGGWTTPSGSAAGEEVGDLCAWNANPPDVASNLALSTGSFAVQPIWANDYNGGAGGCLMSHPIVTNPSTNTVTVTNPGNQAGTVGTTASLQINASDSASGQTLTYSATGLPAGLSINSSSGLISGTPTTAGTDSVTVRATDTSGASGSASFSWTISSSTPTDTVTVINPGSQTSQYGANVKLQIAATDSASGQTLSYSASGLPAGLSISSTGLITGKPTTVGSSTVTVTATDSTSASGSTSFTWTVAKAATQVTASTATTAGRRSFTFHATLTATTGGPISGSTISFSVNGRTYCRATTSTTGAASCSASLRVSASTYVATFAGDSDFLGSSGTAQL